MSEKLFEEMEKQLEEQRNDDEYKSGDLIYLAQSPRNKKEGLMYAQQAYDLDPDNLDAQRLIAMYTAKDDLDLIEKYRKIFYDAYDILKRKGWLDQDYIGHYYGLIETRPYIRLCQHFVLALMRFDMLQEAKKICEWSLYLCNDDNLGLRYILIGIYAYYDDEYNVQRLIREYNGNKDERILLNLAMLYFKTGRIDEAKATIKRCEKVNNNLRKFAWLILQDESTIHEHIMEMKLRRGVQARSIEMYCETYEVCKFLFSGKNEFWRWVNKVLPYYPSEEDLNKARQNMRQAAGKFGK